MKNKKKDNNIEPRMDAYNRVATSLQFGRNGLRPEEWDIARHFWHEVLRDIDWDAAPAAVLLAEEALILRILAIRLMRQINSDVLMVERKTGTDVLNPTVEAWARMQEKFRKVLKELMGKQGLHAGNRTQSSLAAAMLPLLERGEGILNGIFEIESETETIEEIWEEVSDD